MSPAGNDVVICGAGPAGSAAAIRLAAAGARVALLDRETFPRDKLCGGFVSSESLDVLQSLGLQTCPPRGGAAITRLAITTPRGRSVGIRLPGGAVSWGVTRRDLDLRLLEAAAAAGADVVTGVEVTGLIPGEGPGTGRGTPPAGVRARTLPGTGRDASTRDLEIRGRLLVAADGRKSRLSRLLDAGHRRPAAAPPSKRFGFQALFEAPAMAESTVEIHFFRGGYLGLQPVGPGVANACGILDPMKAGAFPPALDDLLAEIRRRSPAVAERLARARRCSGWKTSGGLVFGPAVPQRDGIFFAGDAAGTIEPFTGEGIAMALTGASVLADCLLPLLAGGEPEASLRTYAGAWRRLFLRRLRLCRVLARAASMDRLLDAGLSLMSRRDSIARALVTMTRTHPRHRGTTVPWGARRV